MKKSYRDLNVWHKAIALTEQVYRITEAFPQREHYGISAQTRKSAVSVASNIAEGSARHTDKEFTQFIIIARGSLAELHTQLLIAHRLEYIALADYNTILEQINEIGKMLNGLKDSLSSLRSTLTTNS